MKIIRLFIYLFIFLSINQVKCHSQSSLYDIDKKFSTKELISDIRILEDALRKTHPGLFWHLKEDEFEKMVAKAIDSIKSQI